MKTKANILIQGIFMTPLLLYWMVLNFNIPISVTKFFFSYSTETFLVVLMLFCFSFRLPYKYNILVGLSLIMLLLALTLSYKWYSGFSDNEIIGGLVPYKDGKYYYIGSNLILKGLPIVNSNQATERPLFPSFLSTILFFTGQNLKIALAMIVQLTGIGIFLSARRVFDMFGLIEAGLYGTFLYFYIQPLVGYAMSEMLGFIMGCLGFTIISFVVENPKWKDFMLGILVLMIGISARAGVFFIFPMMALWAGGIFRERGGFSVKAVIYSLGIILTIYLLVNTVYSRFLGIPAGNTFGNFSYAIYGQVHGGTGWYSAIDDLGTRNPSVVYRGAWKFFLAHPFSLLIGFAKAYRDFFLPVDPGIFQFGGYKLKNLMGVIFWLGSLMVLIRSIIHSLKNIHLNRSSFLLASFIGVFLSIPFLPPVDGGARFYASAAPFFFAVLVAGIPKEILAGSTVKEFSKSEQKISQFFAIGLVVVTFAVPSVVYSARPLSRPLATTSLQCASGQEHFVVEMHYGTYIDLIKDSTTSCNGVPNVCFNDFKLNNIEKISDDFYQTLFRLTDNNETNARVLPAVNWVDKKFHYFYISHNKLFATEPDGGILSGCATEIKTQYQSIFKVETIN